MMRQYHVQRARGGDNPLRVGVIAVGSIYYIQNAGFFRDRCGGRAVCRCPWQVEGFLNGTVGAARRNRDTGLWEDAYRSGRSDMALVRSLCDRRVVRQVSVRTLIAHDDLGLWKQPAAYPTLPDVQRVGLVASLSVSGEENPAAYPTLPDVQRVGLVASLSVSREENHDGRC